MAVTSTFNLSTKVAVETDRGTAPSGVRLGRAWWEGGRWFDIITDGLPSLQDAQANIFPSGHAGDRRMNQQAAVIGRKWSEGDLSAPVVADWIMPMLYAAMGAASTNMTPSSSAASKLVAEPLTDGKSLVLSNGLHDGGNILRFDIEGADIPGTISVCGIDSFGNGASELISIRGRGLVYSRTSWSSIAPSGIAVSGLSAGTVTIYGIRHFTHTFTHASVAPTLTFERQGVPTTGEASANQSHIHPAMVLRSLTLETNAEAVDGIFMASADFEGDPSGASAKTTLNGPSSLKIWPSWTLRVTRDGGVQWDVVQNMTLNLTPANANYRAAAGTQGPQGSFFGGVEYTGNTELLLNNELEYKKWQNASQIRMHALWDTPWKLGSATNMKLSASIPAYLENVTVQDSDGKYVLGGDIRVVRDDNFPLSFELTNGVPGTAIGGTAI